MPKSKKRPDKTALAEAHEGEISQAKKYYTPAAEPRKAPAHIDDGGEGYSKFSGEIDHNADAPVERRVRHIAENMALRELGSIDGWEQYVAEVKVEVDWEGFERWKTARGWEHVASFPYRGPDGRLLYEALRFNYVLMPGKKQFHLRHRIRNGPWVHDAGPVRVPYNLPELLARPAEDITLVEGEKGADALMAKGLLATCVQGQKWTNDVAQFFTGRTVNIAMDNDDGGALAAEVARLRLSKVKASVRVLDLPDIAPAAGLDDWLEQHSVDDYKALVARTRPEVSNIKVINPAEWANEIVPEPIFLVQNLLRAAIVALLYGDGGLGKSLLSLDLAVARSSGRDWLGLKTLPGRTLMLSAEDDADELHRRIDAICRKHSTPYSALANMRVIDLVGQDAVIGELTRNGRIVGTELYQFVMGEIARFEPSLVIIDALADSFAGDENNRTQARQFITMLRRPALNYQCAFLCLAHPSLSGINTGRGTSGSTGWSNSVRARMYLEAVEVNGNEPDPSMKRLRLPKGNYTAPGFERLVRYENGVFVPVAGGEPLSRAESRAQAEAVFMRILQRLYAQSRWVGNSPGSNYAPVVFANEPEATELMVSKAALKEAMVQLFNKQRICMEAYGPPARHQRRLVEAAL